MQVEPYFRKKLDITNLVLAVGSGAPAFALASLRKDDKAAEMPDLLFLSHARIKTPPVAAAASSDDEGSRC